MIRRSGAPPQFIFNTLLMDVQQVCRFSKSDLAAERSLLDRVLLARLLALKDGVLALHLCPTQRAVGQIPNDLRQLADLRGGGNSNLIMSHSTRNHRFYADMFNEDFLNPIQTSYKCLFWNQIFVGAEILFTNIVPLAHLRTYEMSAERCSSLGFFWAFFNHLFFF